MADPARNVERNWLRRALRWIAAAALTLAAILLLGGAAALLYLRSVARAALPQLDGELHAAGLAAPVTVRRDAHGVPHISAQSEQDLFFAQGYVTASDRLWQMDIFRRNASGELAEILGPALLDHDKMQRVLRIGPSAARIYAQLPAGERARMEAYARGVNAFITANPNSLPPEFTILHYQPKPWTGGDCLLVGMMLAEDLDTHWQTKLNREAIAQKLDDPQLEADLYPEATWRDHAPTGERVDMTRDRPAPASEENDDGDDEIQSSVNTTGAMQIAATGLSAGDLNFIQNLGLADCEACGQGSNNWVVGGAHTASGKPLLANDMHLGLTLPSIWYMDDLQAGDYHATGVSLPGFPYVIAGHNEHVAWGFTALYADVQDLYTEKLDSKGNYETIMGEWKPLEVDEELIPVRGSPDVKLRVESTGHGPLLNPVLPKGTRPLSLKWTLYDESLHALPIYDLNKAANWGEFSNALSTWCWPTQNVVYADDQGHIAYHAVGSVPIRPAGIFRTPLPHDAMNHRAEWGLPLKKGWQTYIPFDALPHLYDPPSGFVATANARVTTPKSPYALSAEFVSPYRVERIYKLLDGRDHLTAADMLAVQDDVYSEVDQEMAHRLAYAVDHAKAPTAQMKQAADLMRNWDGRLSVDSAAASVVVQSREALWPMILQPRLGALEKKYSWAESEFALEEIVMHGKRAWLPMQYKNWDECLAAAVATALEKSPANVADWNYGSWHTLAMNHPLTRFAPFLAGFAGTGTQPLSGDITTVKQANGSVGPSQRFTMDWGNVDGSTENIPLGESGNPYSGYFKDQWSDWANGRTFPLPFTEGAIQRQAAHTLRLLP